MYKVTHIKPDQDGGVLVKSFGTFKEAAYYAMKFPDNYVLEVKWYSKDYDEQ
jgi:hypothetical protein